MSAAPLRPSDAAQALASLVQSADAVAVEQLAILLTHDLGAPSASERREARLALLMEIVSCRTGATPSVADYEAVRSERRQRGDDAPSAVALINAFGSWLSAVRAAMRMQFRGGAQRVASSHHHAKFRQPAYTRDEVVAALVRCHRTLGAWPTKWEYQEWAALDRRLARVHAKPEPRNPNLKQLRRLFGKFEAAVDVAQTSPFGV